MYIKELYRFTENIPSDAGYFNFEYFKTGSIVFLESVPPCKYCVLCDEEGNPLLDNDDEEIYLDWRPEFSDCPIWEDKLEPYKEIEVEESCTTMFLTPSSVGKEALIDILDSLPMDSNVYLDVDGSIKTKFTEQFGEDSVITLLTKDGVSLIATNIATTTEDLLSDNNVNSLLDSIDKIQPITINFNEDNDT